MKIDVQKIDERIKKLQELRRLATDPEISSILSEFITVGDEFPQPAIPTNVGPPIDMPSPEAANQLVNEVVQSVDAPSNGGLWNRRRG